MSKVLISFLGVGDSGSRLYQSVPYKFIEDGCIVTNEFISLAIRDHYRIDKMILVGTKGSVWETFYHSLTHREDLIYEQLREACSNYSLSDELQQEETTEPLIDHMTEIEKAMGNGSKVILINYGCNAVSQRFNSERIMDIESYLNDDDEVYVDITHSFRSLPMYLMNCLIYIQRVKNIKISRILYGMRDLSIDFVPIVELNSALDIYDWISGVDALMNYGNGYAIYEKLQNSDSDEDKIVGDYIADYSDVFNVNSISNIREVVSSIKDLAVTQMHSKMGQLALRSIVDDCILLDAKSNETDSSYLLQLAKMQYNRRNYGVAFLAFKEAIIYYVVESNTNDYIEIDEDLSRNISYAIKGCTYIDNNKENNNRSVKDKYHRWWSITESDNLPTKWVKKSLRGKDDLIKYFCLINDYRNGIAHLKQSNVGFLDMIEDLDAALDKASEYLQEQPDV